MSATNDSLTTLASLSTVQCGTKTVHLLGTAHVSAQSCLDVENAIRTLQPDAVLVELDEGRLESLRDPNRWKSLDIKQVIKDKQLPTLIANLALSSHQRRMGGHIGVTPGSELLRAVEVAEAEKIPVVLCDRPIKKTLRRIWGSLGFTQKSSLGMSLFASLFDRKTITESDLAQLKQADSLNAMLDEMGAELPQLKHALVTERDWYMAEHIQRTAAQNVLVVIGAAHAPGMTQILQAQGRVNLEELEADIPKSLGERLFFWAISALLIGAIALFVAYKWNSNPTEVLSYIKLWVACTSGPALLAALIARAHPAVLSLVTLLAPFAALLRAIPGPKLSLLSSLTQAWLRPPTVADMENVHQDVAKFSAWWQNRLLRIFLVFLLPGLATTLGAILALALIARQ